MGVRYLVKNVGSPRGFIGMELVLRPGENVVDEALFKEMAQKCPLLRDHLRNDPKKGVVPQVVVLGPAGPGKVRVRLEERTDLGLPRPTTVYRAQKYQFKADEVVELTEEQLNELRSNPYFRSLEGKSILVLGTVES